MANRYTIHYSFADAFQSSVVYRFLVDFSFTLYYACTFSDKPNYFFLKEKRLIANYSLNIDNLLELALSKKKEETGQLECTYRNDGNEEVEPVCSVMSENF